MDKEWVGKSYWHKDTGIYGNEEKYINVLVKYKETETLRIKYESKDFGETWKTVQVDGISKA